MNVSNISASVSQHQLQAANQSQVTHHADHDGDADDSGSAAVSGSPAQPESVEGGHLNTQA